MDETKYHLISEDFINAIADKLEHIDKDGDIEVEYQGGILTIEMPSGKQLLISKHAPTRQIWLSSPISGGLHFSYNEGVWKIPDGRTLAGVLSEELKKLAGINVEF